MRLRLGAGAASLAVVLAVAGLAPPPRLRAGRSSGLLASAPMAPGGRSGWHALGDGATPPSLLAERGSRCPSGAICASSRRSEACRGFLAATTRPSVRSAGRGVSPIATAGTRREPSSGCSRRSCGCGAGRGRQPCWRSCATAAGVSVGPTETCSSGWSWPSTASACLQRPSRRVRFASVAAGAAPPRPPDRAVLRSRRPVSTAAVCFTDSTAGSGASPTQTG